jgi:hypothetical protein
MQEFHVCYSQAYEVVTAYTKRNASVPAALRRPECHAVPDECVCVCVCVFVWFKLSNKLCNTSRLILLFEVLMPPHPR